MSLSTDLLAALDLLALRSIDSECFEVLGTPPAWAAPFLCSLPQEGRLSRAWLCDMFPFLESFLSDAAQLWSGPAPGRIESVSFAVPWPGGDDLLLVASALRLPTDCLLLLDGHQAHLHEQLRLLQHARDAHLVHQRLQRDVLKRDILFHTIVHDLTSQLSAMRGVFQLLQGSLPASGPVPPELPGLLDAGLRAASKQEALIADILDVFRSETGSDGAPPDEATSCDLGACIDETIKLLSPSASWRRVTLRVQRTDGASSGPSIRAESRRVERVLSNLIENALRYAPRGSEISVTLGQRDGLACVFVDDDGPGVPQELGSQLFEKFARARHGGGKTGLGLYFCRLTITRWGGQIGYEPRQPRGARFWFSLPTVWH